MQQAFILHRSPYSNSSLLLECLTSSQGRFPLIAKGANSDKERKRGGSLHPFTPLLINWSGRGEVKNLCNHDVSDRPIPLTGNALYCGFYVNELIMRLVHRNDPNGELFTLYKDTIYALSQSPMLDSVLRAFELNLLALLGYGLNLEYDAVTGEPIDPNGFYLFETETGPIRTGEHAQQAISGSTLLGITSGEELDKQGRGEAKALLRQVISYYIGDKPLKSRELFRTISSVNNRWKQ
ncbi:DNA repair protein RecO [Solemya velesiana gill symbiont]|uniref:DNA repair protein RecO n=2 Tax=Solemya velesiana gill symbiont TaxID=1918948 RepID=A0A1T2KWZ2_9GAMM|nr:DNA repair protein RecO [Solemya velesiana gill symbiont]